MKYKIFYVKHAYDIIEADSEEQAIAMFWNEERDAVEEGETKITEVQKQDEV